MPPPVSRAPRSSAPSPPQGNYTIKKDETLSQLAVRFKTTVDQLLADNPHITNRDVIRAGDKLVVPTATPRPSVPVQQPPATQTPSDEYSRPVERERTTGPIKPPEKTLAPGLDGVRNGETVL